MDTPPTIEDRIWALISHLSALGFGMGILLPIIGWSDQRRKSNYASFQSLQALGYQSLGFTVWALSFLILIIVALLIMLIELPPNAGVLENPNVLLRPIRPWMLIMFTVLVGFFLLYFLVPIIAAVACAFGRDFRYPLMGNRLARYLAYDPMQSTEEQTWLNEDHEFHWVAAMGHFSILILLWGMLASLTTWLLYGKRNYFLKFQSIQTLVYQAATTLLYFVALSLYLLGFLSLILPVGSATAPTFNSPPSLLRLIIFGLFLLMVLIIMLCVPLLHILGQWAGYRVLKGEDYHYPLLGQLVDKWIVHKTPRTADSSTRPDGQSGQAPVEH